MIHFRANKKFDPFVQTDWFDHVHVQKLLRSAIANESIDLETLTWIT